LSELEPESALDLDRERDLGQILSTCLALYTRHFVLFAALALGVVLPIDIGLYGVGAGELWSGYDKNLPLGVDIATNFVPTLLIVPLISANHARAVIRLGAGNVPPIGRTLLEGLFLLPAIAFVVFLYDLGVFGGLILLIVPGIYLVVRWYVCAQAAVVDGFRGRLALDRSRDLVEGSWWRVAGISLVLYLIPAAIAWGIKLPLDDLAKQSDSGVVSLSEVVFRDTIVYSFGALSATLLYFDLRWRHDYL